MEHTVIRHISEEWLTPEVNSLLSLLYITMQRCFKEDTDCFSLCAGVFRKMQFFKDIFKTIINQNLIILSAITADFQKMFDIIIQHFD